MSHLDKSTNQSVILRSHHYMCPRCDTMSPVYNREKSRDLWMRLHFKKFPLCKEYHYKLGYNKHVTQFMGKEGSHMERATYKEAISSTIPSVNSNAKLNVEAQRIHNKACRESGNYGNACAKDAVDLVKKGKKDRLENPAQSWNRMYVEKELPEGVEYKIDDAGRSVLIMSQKLLPPTALALLGDKGYVLDGTENRLQKEMFGATFTKWDSAVAKRKKRKKRKEKRARAKARKYKYVIASRSWDKPKEN